MKIQKKIFAKASFAFLLCICLCGFFNYITLTFLDHTEIHDTKRSILIFLVYFFQVETALVAIFYGDRLIAHRKDYNEGPECYLTSNKLPDEVSHQDRTNVVFVTFDGCMFNGIYHADKKLFCGFDGLDFSLDEISMWYIQKRSFALNDYFKRSK